MATREGWIKRKERYGKSGSKKPEETRKKLLGHLAWNKGKHLIHPGSFKKGHEVPKEWKDAIRKANTGKKRSKEFVKNISDFNRLHLNSGVFKKGQHFSPKTEFKKGQTSWNKRINEIEVIGLYNEGKPVEYISKKLKCHFATIYQILKKKNIKLRERLSGKEHPAWKGGISFEPYGVEFNNKLKRRIRKRDNQICMLCGIHREKLKEALSIHHINYDKNCNLPQNLISLCRKCHGITRENRRHWTKFFQSLLLERYEYLYNEKQEIVLEIKNV